jgi:rhomboid protease GluP
MNEPGQGRMMAPEHRATDPEPAPRPAPKPPSWGERIRSSPVTFLLAAINIAVYIYVESKGSSTSVPTLLHFGASERMHVAAGEYWRLATPMFLHIGLMHLAWNTYASVGWCTAVESAIGKRRFLFVYLLSGVGGACASVIFNRVTSAGASGAMFGIIGATLILRYRVLGSFDAFKRDSFVRSNLMMMAIWTVIGTQLRIDNFAHGGGLVFGAAATWVATRPRPLFGWLALTAGLLTAIGAAARPGWTPAGDDARAAMEYAMVYSTGVLGFEKNPDRAARLADLACREPGTEACTEAALAVYRSGDEAVVPAASSMLQRACEAGEVVACAPASAPVRVLDVGDQGGE